MNLKNKTKTKNSNLERYAGYSYKSPDPSELPIPSFLLLQPPQYYNQNTTSLMFLIEDMKKNQEKN
jgi:hypothetical protein